MRILVANVNTTESMTSLICAAARSCAAEDTEIVGITPRIGAASVESHHEAYLATVGVMDEIRSYDEPFDAIVLAGFGEPGREGLEELFEVPVMDIAETAVHTAYLLGRRYSILTPGIGSIEGPTFDRLRQSGLLDRLASARGIGLDVLALEEDPDRTRELLIEAARCAVAEDGADVLCLGCAGMAGVAASVQQEVGVPVLDGVVLAVQLAEVFHRLGYRRPPTVARRKKPPTVWPVAGVQ
ncbi:aspartate/glutamate racemase family protein [Streptomyces sp. NPDC056165]|uniref:aspartate/glutamate racemase family protein n=1 Tax=Streptomyces sp. NPDC056165 TaxID=3345733 RepID=UPI0035DA6938